ncbi:MAG TPA: TIGR03617 family F420-dependent LLM class oxidoreductase [Caldilinea sp.]|nr:TIGR03617 family F420-dependent LLM class oxidoreductase [Anaerolineales bacterium]HQY90108.1 TIGR03617 family F420-dependent LLM class oxidoreductase [Caldilinea sp.]HRA66374.1 TIGR03617 family F420-dependent LLM class oxidoreductase [Caldilinea sp.]
MKFDTYLITSDLQQMPALAAAIEAVGFDGIWTAETSHNPFLPLTLAAEHTQRISLGTAIAVAFARSPTTLAHIAWDLQRYSAGRFLLGLGTQVKAHVVLRYGMRWEKPVRQLRESIEAIHAVWASWRKGGTSLNYRGEFYTLRLMTPFFAEPPIDYPDPPVYISAVNEQMLRLAGSVCEGVHIHPFHSPRYLREYAWPHLRDGLRSAGRSRMNFTAVAAVFAIPTDGAKPASVYERSVREQLAFYMSTPAYRAIVDLHGWTATAERLSTMARQGEWQAMGDLIDDEMLDAFAVTGTWTALPGIVKQRYAGRLLDRIAYYLPYAPGEEDAGWAATLAGFKEGKSPP